MYKYISHTQVEYHANIAAASLQMTFSTFDPLTKQQIRGGEKSEVTQMSPDSWSMLSC